MIDSTTPGAIPQSADRVALYFNGRFAATQDQAARFTQARVYWIDVLNTSPAACSILDIESGDASPADVPGWVAARLEAHPGAVCRLYSNLSTWPAVKAAVADMPGDHRAQVRYWIANPTGIWHLVPGSDATQYAFSPGGINIDLSAVGPRWDS
jgi:hypothetical protein